MRDFKCSKSNADISVKYSCGVGCKTTEDTVTSESYSKTIGCPYYSGENNMSYGWVCPVCGKVNAPWKESCDCSSRISIGGTTPLTPKRVYDVDLGFYVNPYIPYSGNNNDIYNYLTSTSSQDAGVKGTVDIVCDKNGNLVYKDKLTGSMTIGQQRGE